MTPDESLGLSYGTTPYMHQNTAAADSLLHNDILETPEPPVLTEVLKDSALKR